MTREEFDRLVEKFESGECSQEELALLEEWAGLHFRKYSEHTVFNTEVESLEVEDRIWGKLREGIEGAVRLDFKGERRRTFRLVGLAASVLLLIGVFFFFVYRPQRKSSEPMRGLSGIETKNTTVSQQRIVLPDSSIVVLEAGSVIVADEDYGKQSRTVHLTGGAFFEVKSNPQIPFLVYAGELVTEVLGTSFSIKPESGRKTIEVTVVTGKVSIYAGSPGQDKKRNGVIAVSNQKVVYNTESKAIRQDLVDLPEMIAPPLEKSAFVFDETPLEDVLTQMRQAYGVEIVVGTPSLNQCVFTGDLNDIELYEQLDDVVEVINARYEIRGTTIFVTGTGCKNSLKAKE